MAHASLRRALPRLPCERGRCYFVVTVSSQSIVFQRRLGLRSIEVELVLVGKRGLVVRWPEQLGYRDSSITSAYAIGID